MHRGCALARRSKPRRRSRKKEYIAGILDTLRKLGYPEPETEYIFHEPAPGEKRRLWRLDLAYPDIKIAVEIHGEAVTRHNCPTCKQVISGRHTRLNGFREDRLKMNTAQVQGWLVIECTAPTQLRTGILYTWLQQAFACRGIDIYDYTIKQHEESNDT